MSTRRAVRTPHRAGIDDSLSLELRGGPDAAAHARRAIGKLRADLDPPLMETMRLLVTELVSNSVRHAHADSLTLRVAVGRSTVLTEVTDPGPGFDRSTLAAPGSELSGWGLFLVERLARRWGVSKDGDGTRVWFELRRA